jgi:hypothetical protein
VLFVAGISGAATEPIIVVWLYIERIKEQNDTILEFFFLLFLLVCVFADIFI